MKDYYFDKDMADHCIDRIRLLHAMAPRNPAGVLRAGHCHAPHHAPSIGSRVQRQFESGWDKVREETLAGKKRWESYRADTKLTERSAGIPAWDSFDADHKKVFAHIDGGLCRRAS